jgi:hypothetical protein
MANSALLMSALDEIGHPGLGWKKERCQARARSFALLIEGRLSRVRFGPRAVCQLRRLKEISASQPGFGDRGLGEGLELLQRGQHECHGDHRGQNRRYGADREADPRKSLRS